VNDLQRGAQLGQRIGRALDDRLECPKTLVRLLASKMDCRGGLRIDPDEGVRNRVMELVR